MVYREKAKRIQGIIEMWMEHIHGFPEGSENWNAAAQRLDNIYEAFIGGSMEAKARMLLLECIEIAATFAASTPEQRAVFVENARLLKQWAQTYEDQRAHKESFFAFATSSGSSREYLQRIRPPWEAPEGYVHYDFRKRDGTFSAALGSDEARAKLRECIEVWWRRGAPRKGQPGPDKWGKVQELMALIGLGGAAADTIEAEWRKWRKERHFSPREVLFEKVRLPASVFICRPVSESQPMAANDRIPPLTDTERSHLMREVRSRGEHRAAAQIGVARVTLARALARLPLQAGSVLLIRTGLDTLTAANGNRAEPPPRAA